MRAISCRVLAPVLALFALTPGATAEEYLCENQTGCLAVVETPDGREEIRFREGDIVSTEEGWVVDPGDGWVSLD